MFLPLSKSTALAWTISGANLLVGGAKLFSDASDNLLGAIRTQRRTPAG
jgi:hypothetical protein